MQGYRNSYDVMGEEQWSEVGRDEVAGYCRILPVSISLKTLEAS